MPERSVVITLDEREIQTVEQIVLDNDADSAQRFVRDVVKRKVDRALRPHCKPVFELDKGDLFRPAGPPDEHRKTEDIG
jgi:hypothetical protein